MVDGHIVLFAELVCKQGQRPVVFVFVHTLELVLHLGYGLTDMIEFADKIVHIFQDILMSPHGQ